MPTGYTSELYDGEQTLEDYIKRCARAFIGSMRDSSWDAPLPIRVERDSYFAKLYEAAKKTYSKLLLLTPEQAELRAGESNVTYVKNRDEALAGDAIRRERYTRMVEQINGWHPSEDLSRLKTFMLQQLEVDGSGDISQFWNTSQETGPGWLADALSTARRDILYYKEELVKEQTRDAESNRWFKVLHEELAKLRQEV